MRTRKQAGISLRQLWHAVGPVAGASPFAWLATFAVGHAVGTHPALIALLAAVVAGLLTYALGIWLYDRSVLREATMQLLRIFGRERDSASLART